MDDITERKLGIYEEQDLFLKKGKYGIYCTWGENKKSLNSITVAFNDIEMEDVIQSINRASDASLVRKLSDNLMIRNGKFGDYIFYKTSRMTKPRFLKLNGFNDDYKNCDIEILLKWIKDTYKV